MGKLEGNKRSLGCGIKVILILFYVLFYNSQIFYNKCVLPLKPEEQKQMLLKVSKRVEVVEKKKVKEEKK